MTNEHPRRYHRALARARRHPSSQPVTSNPNPSATPGTTQVYQAHDELLQAPSQPSKPSTTTPTWSLTLCASSTSCEGHTAREAAHARRNTRHHHRIGRTLLRCRSVPHRVTLKASVLHRAVCSAVDSPRCSPQVCAHPTGHTAVNRRVAGVMCSTDSCSSATDAVPHESGLERSCGMHRATTTGVVTMPGPITGEARTQLAADLAAQYEQGTPSRSLAESSGRSYGSIHQLLTEAGVTLRPRGRRR